MSNFHYFTYGSLCSTGWVKWSWFWVPNHAPLYPMFLDLFILADGSSPLPQQRWDPGSRRRLLQKGCTSVAVLCSLSKLWELVMDREAGMLQSMGSQRHDWVTELKSLHWDGICSPLYSSGALTRPKVYRSEGLSASLESTLAASDQSPSWWLRTPTLTVRGRTSTKFSSQGNLLKSFRKQTLIDPNELLNSEAKPGLRF